MEKVRFQKTKDDAGRIVKLELSGLLTLENAELIKNKFIEAVPKLSPKVHFVITDLDDIDLAGIQLIVAFLKEMHKHRITYTTEWKIVEDQKVLLENVGLNNELFIES
jgi:anti-anti-sigma regulatory factor